MLILIVTVFINRLPAHSFIRRFPHIRDFFKDLYIPAWEDVARLSESFQRRRPLWNIYICFSEINNIISQGVNVRLKWFHSLRLLFLDLILFPVYKVVFQKILFDSFMDCFVCLYLRSNIISVLIINTIEMLTFNGYLLYAFFFMSCFPIITYI